ncbi:PREDICTED: isoleucine N-monooxygenase 1-like [Ipomoea nil]|uniref:isoleucine N-monooxygenase 1-like n=1 Tax=Ipomoea nil TaxID=35883 RepID=UPI0009009B99|nr:PREDICTED: isoleucine N-monooxygenase 1-like [Ipomoea nil]
MGIIDMLIISLPFLSLILPPNVVIILIISVFLSCKWLNNQKAAKQFPLPPGPMSWPVVGCFPQMLTNKPVFRWMLNLMEEMNTEIACFRLGGTNVISVTSPEVAREILMKQDSVFASRPACLSAQLISSNYLISLVTPLGDQWKKMRRVLTSRVLSPNTLNWLAHKRAAEADHLVRYIYNQCRNAAGCGVVDVRAAGRHFCGNVIRQMVFSKRHFGAGVEDGGPGVEEEEHVNATFGVLAYVYSFGISDYFPWLRMFDLDGHRKALKKAVKGVRKHQDPEVDARIKMWNNGTETEQQDILDVLIKLKDIDGRPLLTSEEIKAQILELMIGIVDNPSNTTEWVLAEMLNKPDILQNATEELDNIVGRERLVQESDLPKLNYLNACIREAFRLHPFADFAPPHLCTSDTTVSNYFIPKDSHVIISRPGLGRNPRVWEEPLKFMPERHLKNDGSEVSFVDPELRILSFSTGRRGCPGIQLGSLVSSMLLARLVQGFDWVQCGRIELRESKHDLLLAHPLHALAKPRLPHYIYSSLE